MKLELITNEFKNMLVKASKGAGNDKLSPLTTYLGLQVKDKDLTIRTTDGANFTIVIKKNVNCDDFTAVVECDSFVNLIKKTTSEHLVLTIEDDIVKIKGNGNYEIPCVVDEHGQAFQFPQAEANIDLTQLKPVKVKSRVFKTVFDVNTASVAKTLDTPVLTGFYFGKSVMTTDSLKLCQFAIDVFGREALLPLDLLKLTVNFTDEDVMTYFSGSDVVFVTSNLIILGSQMQDIETYPVDTLESLVETEYESTCKIKKVLLNACLDRLSIFVNEYEKNAITLQFTKKGLEVLSKKAKELIPFDDSQNFVEFSCLLELPKLKEQMATLQEDIVEFGYGNPDTISIKEGKVTHILSTMEQE